MLLRRITQHVRNQNWFAVFLDFVIVVVGVFIGIQVANWNDSIKEQNLEAKYLQNIVRDLNEQLILIDLQKNIEKQFLQSADSIISSYYESDNFVADDELFNQATLLTIRRTFVVIDPTYTDLLSSGNLNIIKNDNIKNQIIRYYQLLERFDKVVQNNNTLITDQNYSEIFLKYGYYSTNRINSLGLVEINPRTNANDTRATDNLQKIASENLSNENLLMFMNVVKQRAVVAEAHVGFMDELKTETQRLIQVLN